MTRKSDTIERLRTPHKLNKLVLAPSFTEGDFDSIGVDVPFLFRHDGRYWMTFVGFDGVGYRTGLAVSDDLVNWEKQGLLIDRGPAGSPTEFNVAMSWIIRENDLYSAGELKKFDGKYVGTYHAYPAPGYESGPAAIGICTSTDLRSWEMRPPCFHAQDGADWEYGGLYKSCIVEHEGTFYMFYNAKTVASPWVEQTGLAVSTDLEHWERYEGNPVIPNGPAGAVDDRFCSDPCVMRMDNMWVMFYFTLSSDGHARETAAVSSDLVHWEKTDEVLIDVGPEGSIDADYAHKPGVIVKDGVLYHYYCAVGPRDEIRVGKHNVGQNRGISLAVSDASVLTGGNA